ncbi:MAG: Ig-like domain-containing protein [Synergistaceae bacterium]|nr:Ig-like domain-containing protein [Synergistaceae bacterium]
MRKILLLLCALGMLTAPAYSDEFVALERGLTAGRIIRSVSENSYLTGNDTPITEASISALSSDYGKTGLVADGNTRLILRYQSDTAGTVAFSVSPSIPGSRLERLTDRSEITAPVPTTSTGSVNQASAVFIAPESWPSALTYPKGTFTVTATFTPTSGTPSTKTLTLTLQAPPVVLIHGAFGTNERAFGYTQGTRHGVWQKLEDAGLTVASWNYPNEKSPKEVIANNSNGLAKILSDTFDSLNSQGIAATRADLVTHSSGGLMARQYLRNDIDTGNNTPNSYGLGTVRRVVTIASPNLGSNVSSYCAGKFDTLPSSWQNWSAKETWESLIYAALRALVFERKNATEVMEDTSLKSTYIANLGYPDIPFHSIYGKVSADTEKFNQLFEDVMNNNVAALSKTTWLPEYLVNLLLAADLDTISSVLKIAEPMLKFRELLGALFGSDDHDLIVSETSAKDIFPSNAVTAFNGMGTHNHILIAQQDDVGDRVVALLKGGTESFMVNTASSAEYDRAFDALVSDYDASRVRGADDTDLSQYIDQSLALNVSDPEPEYMGADDERPVVQSMNVSGTSETAFNDRILVRIVGDDGAAKFFMIDASGDKSFDVEVWAGREDKGILEVAYATLQDGKVKLSQAKTVAVPPLVEGIVTGLTVSKGTIYCHVDDETPIGLVAHTEDGNYDISAPALGVASWTNSDPSVAEITDEGSVKALKEGTTTITATAQGHSVKVNVVVLSSSSAEDATKDLVEHDIRVSSGSSSGCNAGYVAPVMLLAVLTIIKKSR